MTGTKLGIDLGTSKVAIYQEGHGVVLREPAVLAVEEKTGRLIAGGREAQEMIGREPPTIRLIRPMKGGVISDSDYAQQLLTYLVRKVCAYKVFKPRAAVSIPALVTEVEQRSVVKAATAAGIRRVALVENYVAAAVGAGLEIRAPRGCMVVDLGAGTTDIAVLSLRGVACGRSLRVGGDDLDEAIVRGLRAGQGHLIGKLTAEAVKKQIGSALPGEDNPVMAVRGRDMLTGLPRSRQVDAHTVWQYLQEPLSEILQAVQWVLENTPPELAGDVMEDGMVLTGGGAGLAGMAEFLQRETRTPCRVAEHPADCVAIGTGRVLPHLDAMRSGVYDINQFTSNWSEWAEV